MHDGVTYQKSKRFAVRIIKLYQFLREDKKEYVLSKQLLRCGTSIGANISEANCAISKKDFLAKMYVAFKECSETEYWIELLYDSEILNAQEYQSIIGDCREIKKLLSSITKTIKENKRGEQV